MSLFLKDDVPELAESFLVNISGVELIQGSEVAGQPSVKRPGLEVAEVTISENDDARGILQFNVSDVSAPHSRRLQIRVGHLMFYTVSLK